LNGHYVCSDDCRKNIDIVEINAELIDINVEDEIKKSNDVLIKSQELNTDINKLRRMQEEIEYLKSKHDNIKVDMNIDLSKFNKD